MKTTSELIEERTSIKTDLNIAEKTVAEIRKKYLTVIVKRGIRLPNGRIPKYKTFVCKDENIRKEKSLEFRELESKIAELKEKVFRYDELIHESMGNDILGIKPEKNKNNTSPVLSKSIEEKILYIVKIVSNWKNIEGNYSQNKLATKMNMNKSTLSRFLDKKITIDGEIKTVKRVLIKKVSDGMKQAEGRDNYEFLGRLKHFHECLTTEPIRNDRTKGKNKSTYFNKYENE